MIVDTYNNDFHRAPVVKLKSRKHQQHSADGVVAMQEPVEVFIPEDAMHGVNNLLLRERPLLFDPNTMYNIKPEDDKVDGRMRDDAVTSILGLHKAFLDLSPEVFCQSVAIVDQFIMRVKVKPKYMSCVATAAYYLAAQQYEEVQNRPSLMELVNLMKCGGTTDDLSRMGMIIRSKLPGIINITSLDYLKLFNEIAQRSFIQSKENYPTKLIISGDTQQKVISRLLVSLTSMRMQQFSPACVSLACLYLVKEQDPIFRQLISKLTGCCQMSMDRVVQCSIFIRELYDRFYQPGFPNCWDRLNWCLSRRTRCNLVSLKNVRRRGFHLESIREAIDGSDGSDQDSNFNISNSFSSASSDEDMSF